jgi:hypothetical protein
MQARAPVPDRGRVRFWALVALAGATRLAIVLADYRSLIGNDVYPDDAFYYLQIAANVVAGRGWTFDGLAPTNGFQPLYMLMVVPIVALSRGQLVLPIHLTGVLLTGWAVATAIVLHALLLKLAGRRTALFGLLLWAICPYFILMSINGLETGVAAFFVLFVPWLYLSWFCGERPPDPKRVLAFGGVCGAAVLARIDLVLLLAAVSAHWLTSDARRHPRRALAVALIAAGGAAAVWLPWGLVSHAATGHWLPTSGAASRAIALNFGWLNMQPIWPHLSTADRVFDPTQVPPAYTADVATKLAFVFLLENPLLAPLRANVPAGAWADLDRYFPFLLFLRHPALCTALLLGAPIGVVVWQRRRARARPAPPAQAPPAHAVLLRLLGVSLPLFAIGYSVYAPAHWYFNRYLVGPILLSLVYLLARADLFFSHGERRAAGLVAALVIGACQLAQWQCFAPLRWSDAPTTGFLASWRGLGAKVDPQARIGSFQAGIYGYFGAREVVNLDGKVNQDSFEALRGKRLHEYIRAQGVRYILDRDWILDALCARHAPPGSFAYRAAAIGQRTGGVQLFEVLDPGGRP